MDGARSGIRLAEMIEACDEAIPIEVCAALAELVHQLHRLDEAIDRLDKTIAKAAQADERARRLITIRGVGPITASAIVASAPDISGFEARASSPPFSA